MAGRYTGYLRIKTDVPRTALQQRLLEIIHNKEAMREVHQKLGEMCQDYVPMRTGSLRASMRAYPKSVVWESEYAHYQYEGVVYGRNRPITVGAEIKGWYSVAPKYPTKRELGVPGEWMGWEFGYKTPGTHHHWLEKAMANGGRRTFSIRVTNTLKKTARRLKRTW